MSKMFNSKTFALLGINYIIGFGFVATISDITTYGYYGILIIFLVSLMALGVALVFSRLLNEYPNELGSSFSYATKVKNKPFAFFVGWNQYIQGPLYAGSGTLFLTQAARVFTENETYINIVRVVSITIFILLIFSASLGLKVSKKMIFVNIFIKWAVLIIGFVGLIILACKEQLLLENFNTAAGKSVDTYLILTNVLYFMFAFGGIETIPTLSKDVKTKNFKKVMMVIFLFVFTFYIIGYLLIGSTNLIENSSNAFLYLYRISFGVFGQVLFAIYIITYNIASTLTSTIGYSRALASLSQAGYLPSAFGVEKKGEYKNAIWFNFALTVVSLVLFSLLPLIIQNDQIQYFQKVISIGTIAFLVQYLGTFITALILAYRKQIKAIPWYEQFLYYYSIILILVVLLANFIPPIVGQKFMVENAIILIAFVMSNLLGISIYWANWKLKQRAKKNSSLS